MKKGYCDNCSKLAMVRRIELGSGSGTNLCNKCLKEEVRWRKQRNKKLSKANRFRTKYKWI